MSTLPIAPPAAPVSAPPSLVWRRIRRNPLSFTALCVIVGIALIALFAPLVAPYPPDATDAGSTLQSVSWQHWLGTDLYGRDQLSRIIYAARVDLSVAFAATAAAVAVGALLGAVVGYRGGWVDNVAMRAVDSVMAFPALPVAIWMGVTVSSGLMPSLVLET